MVNIKKINELIKWRNSNLAEEPNFINWPFMRRDFWTPLMEALGDDEEKIIEFIKTADEETQGYVSGIMEELYDKFPTDKMGDFIDSMWSIK